MLGVVVVVDAPAQKSVDLEGLFSAWRQPQDGF